jgi:hypothetical protein
MPIGPALFEGARLNPGYLKLDLFCRGLRLAPDCALAGRQGALRVRAGLGSGLEMRIVDSDGMYVNAPVAESFAAESPYELHGPRSDGKHWITHEGRAIADVIVPPLPAFFETKTSSGKPMGSVGIIQGTYLGVYYGMLCANWKRPDEDACRFCAVGNNVSEGGDRTDKNSLDVVETALAARKELGITFVHVNGGFDDRGEYLTRFGPLMERLQLETGLLTGLQLPPLPDLEQYQAFKRLGVNNMSLCFEFWDPVRFQEICPGKDRRAGLDSFKEAISFCAQEARFDTTNGELIAGLEDPGSSMQAIDWLTEVGAVPTICVFRPVQGTHYEDRSPPKTEDMAAVFGHAYARCMDRGLPIGIAPNVKVSIVMNPEECRWLLPPSQRNAWKLKRLKNAAMRRAFGAYFRRRLRKTHG